MRLHRRKVVETSSPDDAQRALEQVRAQNMEVDGILRDARAVAESLQRKIDANHVREMIQVIAGVAPRPS